MLSHTSVQVDIGSAHQVISPKYPICAHQAQNRIDTPNKNKSNATLDNLKLRKYHVETDSVRYPRYSLLLNYGENDYFEQYKNLKIYFREYVDEPILYPFLSYSDM